VTSVLDHSLSLPSSARPRLGAASAATLALLTAAGLLLDQTGTAQACNVYWQVASSATLGSDTVFAGNILALASISLDSRASIAGRALARTGGVTMIDNVITRPACTTAASRGAASGGSGSGRSGANGAGQVRRVPVGSVDAGDGSSLLGRASE
jgi:hypothetical protein